LQVNFVENDLIGEAMKKIFSTLVKLINPKKKSVSAHPNSDVQKTTERTVRISDEFEINVKGIPADLTTTEQKQLFASLLKSGLNLSQDRMYQKGDNIFRGKASLNIKDKVHKIEYSISAMKVLQALSVYKEAFDYVNQGAEDGKFDPQMAEMAADFLKESAWQEILKLPKPNQKSFTTVDPVETGKQISTQKHIEEEGKHGNE
jgi:hypothetical protein